MLLNSPLLSAQPTAIQSPQLSDQASDLKGVQILVVDDDIDTQDFIAFLLEQAGATVTRANSVGEAMIALTHAKPNILLSDIGMPEMDGYMFMQQIRALPTEKGGDIPAIALTAYAGEIDQHRALSVGFQRHIPKPVEPERLIWAITELLEDQLDGVKLR